MHWMALQYIWDQKLSLDAIWLFFCQNMRNRHLNVWLEDLVEEPLNAGEDESRDEQNVRKVESELSYHRSLLLVKIGWEIFSHQVHCVCKRFWPTTRGGQGGPHCLACPHIDRPAMFMSKIGVKIVKVMFMNMISQSSWDDNMMSWEPMIMLVWTALTIWSILIFLMMLMVESTHWYAWCAIQGRAIEDGGGADDQAQHDQTVDHKVLQCVPPQGWMQILNI